MSFDVGQLRAQFPMLARPGLVYLDNAATTHKPRAVIDAVTRFYAEGYATVHRGVYPLSEAATAAYEGAREAVAAFVGARAAGEIVFTRGATSAVNLVARSYGQRLERGDEVLISELEHHANIVPWQMLCRERGATLRVAPVDEAGALDVSAFERFLGPRTRIVAVTLVSNALGTVVPVAAIAAAAHRAGAVVLVDAAQAAAHLPLDVAALGADFLVLSGHKVYGPTGIGALYGRADLLADMPPWEGGGEMIRRVTFEATTYAEPPYRFEAGTPPIAAAIGLGAALRWLAGVDRAAARAHEDALLAHARAALAETPGVRLVGDPPQRASVVSFTYRDVHPHDVGAVLARAGICVRAGHHCAMPILAKMGAPATVRASVAAYTTREEIDALVAGLARVREVFGE